MLYLVNRRNVIRFCKSFESHSRTSALNTPSEAMHGQGPKNIFKELTRMLFDVCRVPELLFFIIRSHTNLLRHFLGFQTFSGQSSVAICTVLFSTCKGSLDVTCFLDRAALFGPAALFVPSSIKALLRSVTLLLLCSIADWKVERPSQDNIFEY